MAGRRRDKLVEYFLSNPDLMRLPDAAVVQAKWNAALRLETLKAYPPMKPEEAAELLSLREDQVLAAWGHWAEEGGVFSITNQGERLFPAFQFDPSTGKPRGIISELLSVFEPGGRVEGWPVYLWLTHPRPALGDRVPANILDDEPEAVLVAAKAEMEPIEG